MDLEISDKRVTFQGIIELQIDLEEKVLASHTCLRYSKGAPGSHNSSAHRIMYIRRVEKKIQLFWSFPPKKGPFWEGNGANGKSGPETKSSNIMEMIFASSQNIDLIFYILEKAQKYGFGS